MAAGIPPAALLAYADALPSVGGPDGLTGTLPGALTTGSGVTGGSSVPIGFGFGPVPVSGGIGGDGIIGGGGDTGGGDTGGGTPGDGGGGGDGTPVEPTTPVPEPQTWLLMIAGFGFVGMGLRWRRRRAIAALGPVAGPVFRRRRRTRAAGGASTLMAGLGFGEVATGSASMATIAAKTMMCVCPTVAIMGATIATPPVRTAVHKATAVPAPKLAMVPIKPPCDPTLRSVEARPPSRIIDEADASPKVAKALLASTSVGGQ